MQLPKRRPKSSQPRLLFMDSSQAELWTSLSREQQQTCQELLHQLLQQVLRDPNEVDPNQERSASHE